MKGAFPLEFISLMLKFINILLNKHEVSLHRFERRIPPGTIFSVNI